MSFLGCSTTEPHLPRSVPGALKIGTYNVYFGTPDPRDNVAVIRQMNADVIVLQEVVPRSAAVLDRELASTYPHRVFEGGLGMVSRYPLHGVRFERSRSGINGFMFAEIEYHRERVQIVDLHLDPLRIWTLQDKLMFPLQWHRQAGIHRAELAQALPQLRPGIPTILIGDLNRASDYGVNHLRSLGYIDSFAAVTPNPDGVRTVHLSALGLRMGKRVDFIFHDSSFETIASTVVPGSPSDHDAVVSILARKPTRP